MTVSVPQHDDQIIFHEGVYLDQRCGQRYVFQPFTQTLAPGCVMSVWLQCDRSNLHLESNLQDVTDGMLCHSRNFLLTCSKSAPEVLSDAKKNETQVQRVFGLSLHSFALEDVNRVASKIVFQFRH